MKKAFIIIALCGIAFIFPDWTVLDSSTWGEETPLSEVMVALGEPKPHHYRENTDPEMIKRGFELITKGKTIGPDGKKSRRISRFFQCTHCHNINREDPDLTQSNPEARLEYAVKNNLPFLQGTTFWGIVNRRSWYNDDYIKKYGDLVLPTNDTLINAIQLCCKECSQGRTAEEWEVESMLAYFYSIGMKLGDLSLSKSEFAQLQQDRLEPDQKIELLRNKYLTKSPATFMEPKYGGDRKYGEQGDAAKGKEIYEHSCLHCHNGGGVTTMTLSKDKLDMSFLSRHMDKNGEKSIYMISRRGTYAKTWYKPYMPLYTKERMSEKQLENLAAYINAND